MRLIPIAAAAALLLGVPAVADAATVEPVDSGFANVLTFTAAPGEQNRVALTVEGDRFVVSDAGAPLEARGDCVSEAPGRVTCPLTGLPHAKLRLDDGNDAATAELPDQTNGRDNTQVDIGGGSGTDDLRGSAHITFLTGEGDADGDSLTVTGGQEAFVFAGDDADRITSQAALSSVSGAGGDDVITGGTNAYGGLGNDTINAGAQGGNLRGEEGNDTLMGAEAADTLDGGPGDDDLHGGVRGDTLLGGDGQDKLDGGGGDTFHFDDPPAFNAVRDGQFVDRLDGGPGADVINGGDGDFDWVTYAGRRSSVLASLDGRRNDGEPGERDLIGVDVEHIEGGEADDALRGSADGNFLYGKGGDDTIDTGGGYHDVGYGQSGDDTIITLDGGLEGRVGLAGPLPFSGYKWDDAVRCDDSPADAGTDTAVIDPTDGGENSQLATGGCETVFMSERPASLPVAGGTTVPVPVTCGSAPADATCSGQAAVEQYLPSVKGRASKKRVVGTAKFRARTNKRSQLRVKLNSTGRKAARGKRRLSAVRVAYRFKRQRR